VLVAPSTSTPAAKTRVDVKAKQQTRNIARLHALIFFFFRSIENHHITTFATFGGDGGGVDTAYKYPDKFMVLGWQSLLKLGLT